MMLGSVWVIWMIKCVVTIRQEADDLFYDISCALL